MGLLDSLFSPSTYGGQGGGLLDMLQQYAAMPGTNVGQYNPRTLQPDSTIPVGGYQMPVFGRADPAQLPPNSTLAQGQMPPTQAAPMQQSPDNAPLTSNPAFLQPPTASGFGGAMRGALANAQNGPLGMLFGGIAGGMGMGQGNPQDIARQNLKAQYDSLVPVLGPQKAMLAVMNPEAGKTLLQEAMTNKETFKTIKTKDALGNETETPYWVNEREQTMRPAAAPGGPAVGGTNTGMSMTAPGVTQIDSSKVGDDYLNQFSPEVKAAVKSYMDGAVMPTGNARQQSIATLAKTIAQKYGADIGQPADDYTYAAKRKMRTDLASSGNSSMGGILSNGKSAFEHLNTYSDALVKVGNTSHDFPFGDKIAQAQNYLGNEYGGSTQKGKVAAANEAGLKYGQESTKFYAGSGGGEGERMAALKANDATSTSGGSQAGFIEAERNLMVGRLKEKEAQIRDTLGDDYLKAHPVFTPELNDTIKKIDDNISKLRGNHIEAGGQIDLKPGQSAAVGGVTIKRVN